MTNKEAIKQLKWVKKRICEITYSPESYEALNLAIKALEENDELNNQIVDLCKNLAVIADMGEETENE